MKYIPLIFLCLTQSSFAKTWSMNQTILNTLKNSAGSQILQAQKSADALILSEALSPFDWQIELSRSFPESLEADFDIKKFTSSFSLKKKWLYGLNITAGWCQAHSTLPCRGLPPSPYPRTISLNLEKNIFRNFMGREDRLKLRSANYKYESLQLARTEEVKQLILSTANKFWRSYVFSIYVQQARKRSRDYKELAGLAQQKSKLGHTRPGEIPQILSQYQRALKQKKEMEVKFKNSMIELKDFTKIEDPHFKFQTHRSPPLPRFSAVKNIEQLNTLQKARASYLSAAAGVEAQKYFYLPYVKIHAGADFMGREGESLKSSELKNYKVGVSAVYSFSHSPARWKRRGALRSKKLQHELEYQDQKQKVSSRLKTQHSLLVNAHSSLRTSSKILKLQKQAMDEIRKSYIQGRSSIGTLISAQDRHTKVEKENLQAQKNYSLSLLKYYALRDELLSRYEK